jgi:hypothetical protein
MSCRLSASSTIQKLILISIRAYPMMASTVSESGLEKFATGSIMLARRVEKFSFIVA